jgi:2'-5' RNA ligase
LPKGRIIEEKDRHLTLVFLGDVSYEKTLELWENIPLPSWKSTPVGSFDSVLFLPNEKKSNVVCWHPVFSDCEAEIFSYQELFAEYWRSHGYEIDTRPFLPHCTLARQPFTAEKWKGEFRELPFSLPSLQLYESLGGLKYTVRRQLLIH